MANNATIFDAALAGVSAGMHGGRQLKSAVAADYTNFTARVEAVATEVDSLIATTSITVPQANLMAAICEGFFTDRGPQLNAAGVSSITASDYATIAAEIVAVYTQVSAQLV